MVAAIIAVAVPGRKNASILFGVLKIAERIKEREIISIPTSNFPRENSSLPLISVLREEKRSVSATPKARTAIFGAPKGFANAGRTASGRRKMVR